MEEAEGGVEGGKVNGSDWTVAVARDEIDDEDDDVDDDGKKEDEEKDEEEEEDDVKSTSRRM